ncbi:MAG: hypothetical protein HYW34_03570 [Candidatus Brennerbacteria bacterium]|nr:hypothetical protein [Candidatus Brennerbacteria bacterium]
MPLQQPGQQQATQQFVDIEDIKDGVIILKNGGLRQVLMVSGVNFDLKSEEEQNLIINSYQNFLNSLDFSIQLMVHSRHLNIDSYLEKLKDRREQETNPLLKTQLADYMEFIRSFVESNAIMNKTFFAVVPYEPAGLSSIKAGGLGGLLSFFGGAKKPAADKTAAEQEKLTEKIQQLSQRTGQVITGLNQIGLRAVPLDTEETGELFYNFYNPEDVERKGIEIFKQNE